MSNMRKWIEILHENSELLPGISVKISDDRGGGIGVLKSSCPKTYNCVVDVKGTERVIPLDDLVAVLNNDDDYQSSPTETISPGYIESGDSVKVQDFYGSGTGDAYGMFVGYSHDGQSAIINIDSEERSISVDLVYPADENEAKNNFDKLDNDGDLSPMSYGNNNRKDSNMSDFEKWFEAVSDDMESEDTLDSKECKCGSYDCEKCYPITEDEMSFYGADTEDDVEPRIGDDESEDFESYLSNDEDADDIEPAPAGYATTNIDVGELIGEIDYLQNLGMSDSPKHYDIDDLMQMRPEAVLKIHSMVTSGDDETIEDSVGAGGVAMASGDQGKIQDRNGVYESSNDEETVTESRRKIKKVSGKDCHAMIYRDAEWDEYVVKFFDAAGHKTGGDYHTDDLGDAEGTANLELRRMCSSNDGKVDESHDIDFDGLVQAGTEMMNRGMDLDQVVMALADQHGFGGDMQKQHELYNLITNQGESPDRIKKLAGL